MNSNRRMKRKSLRIILAEIINLIAPKIEGRIDANNSIDVKGLRQSNIIRLSILIETLNEVCLLSFNVWEHISSFVHINQLKINHGYARVDIRITFPSPRHSMFVQQSVCVYCFLWSQCIYKGKMCPQETSCNMNSSKCFTCKHH